MASPTNERINVQLQARPAFRKYSGQLYEGDPDPWEEYFDAHPEVEGKKDAVGWRAVAYINTKRQIVPAIKNMYKEWRVGEFRLWDTNTNSIFHMIKEEQHEDSPEQPV